ncbi:MAG: hypothetical protein NC405_04645 [Odoribacter sp.]|nr:hypothetical protein [Odoribacter sp.]
MNKSVFIIFLLLVFSTHLFQVNAYSIRRESWWSLNNDSPTASKITITRSYSADTRNDHAQRRVMTVWFAPDSTCLAWSSFWEYEPKEYGSDKWLPMRTDADTIQADFSGTPIMYPVIENSLYRGFELIHFATESDAHDRYGNWLTAYTREYHHDGDCIERKIEYTGSESPTTKAEIEHFLYIRNNGLQNKYDALSKSDRISLGINEATRVFGSAVSLVMLIIGLACGIIVRNRYSRWNKIARTPGKYPYNTYNPLVWIMSAVSIYCMSVAISGIVFIDERFAAAAIILQVIYALSVVFKILPGVARMLLYARSIGYWGSMMLLAINLLATGKMLADVLCVTISPVIGVLAAIIVTFIVGLRYFWDQAYKCPKCHAYDGTQFIGIEDGGRIRMNSQNTKEEEEIDGLDIVRRTTQTNRNDYYRREIHWFYCPECNCRWKRTVRGGYIGSDKKKRIKEDRQRLEI